MLPPSHVAYTVATLSEIQKHSDYFEDADYRLVALGAIAPDLLDKPLSWAYFHQKYKSGRFFAHTFLVHATLFFYTLWKAPHQLVYALSFNGHALADKMWNYKKNMVLALTGVGIFWQAQRKAETARNSTFLLVCPHPSTHDF